MNNIDLTPTDARPKSYELLKNIAQNQSVMDIIIDAYKSAKFPHSWIFSGPKGIGKSDIAIRTAHYLLSFPNASLAPDCFPANISNDPIYSQIVAGSHPDLIILKRSQNNKTGKLKQDITVSEARKVSQFFSRRASGQGWRICIIDTADDLNGPASNALLKIVEEPPENSLILFISHSTGRLLPTLRSRCRLVKCAPINSSEITQCIESQESDTHDPDIELISVLAEGSISKAASLNEGGLEMYREMMACLETLPKPEWNALNKLFASLTGVTNKEKFTLFTDLLVNCLRRMTVNTATGSWHESLAREKALAEKWGLNDKLDVFSNITSHLETTFQDKEIYNLDPSLTLSQVFQELAREAK